MKKLIGLILLFCLSLLPSPASPSKPTSSLRSPSTKIPVSLTFQDGDLIFQSSRSSMSKAIQLTTRSPYSHCGLIYRRQGGVFVLEAIQPVSLTPLKDWIKRGRNGHYVLMRLKNSSKVLTPEIWQKMKILGDSFVGKDYDGSFAWSDERIYCSELIWKIYQRATGLEIGQLQRLKEFDLSSPLVKKQLALRYGAQIPLNEWVISPAAMLNSPLLEKVNNSRIRVITDK